MVNRDLTEKEVHRKMTNALFKKSEDCIAKTLTQIIAKWKDNPKTTESKIDTSYDVKVFTHKFELNKCIELHISNCR